MKNIRKFYPDRNAIKILNEIVEEVNLIMYHPFRTLQNSRFKNLHMNDDTIPFLKLYKPEYKQIEILDPIFITGPVMLPFVNKTIKSKQIRDEKKKLYQELEFQLSAINELILTELWSERKELLNITKSVLKKVIQEVKSDLLE